MPSFDVVSEIDMQEARNAVENAQRELETRFDFRGTEASFTWQEKEAVLKADADFQLDQMVDILRNKLIKRNIDIAVLDVAESVHSGKTFTRKATFKEGIDTDFARKIVKHIKESKMKVQAAIQGDQVRVTGKKRDDLQEVIAMLKQTEWEQPLQFKNFRD